MNRPFAFWDASALVPLCVGEPATPQAYSELRKLAPIVWWGTSVEIHSAIARLRRAGQLSELERKMAVQRLSALSGSWKEILPDNELRELASQLLHQHELGAADSLQLAAALAWCRYFPKKRVFVCSDKQLARAADASGFTILHI